MTGSPGFIGANLVMRLLQEMSRGTIVSLDNMNDYAATKKSNELLAHSYAKLYNIPSTGLRFFTVYGPAGRPDMFYYSATEKLDRGETIQIYNYGNCRRDFTYIDDIVEGCIPGHAGGARKDNRGGWTAHPALCTV